jgi:hypothetical protein
MATGPTHLGRWPRTRGLPAKGGSAELELKDHSAGRAGLDTGSCSKLPDRGSGASSPRVSFHAAVLLKDLDATGTASWLGNDGTPKCFHPIRPPTGAVNRIVVPQ